VWQRVTQREESQVTGSCTLERVDLRNEGGRNVVGETQENVHRSKSVLARSKCYAIQKNPEKGNSGRAGTATYSREVQSGSGKKITKEAREDGNQGKLDRTFDQQKESIAIHTELEMKKKGKWASQARVRKRNERKKDTRSIFRNEGGHNSETYCRRALTRQKARAVEGPAGWRGPEQNRNRS